jgi:hypothetical protein
MNAVFESLLAAALAWLGVFVSATLVAAALYGGFRRLAAHAPATSRGLALFLYAVLPPLIGTLVICLLNFSALYSVLLPAHCHGGNCAPHAPEFAASAAQAAVVVAIMVTAAAVVLSLPVKTLVHGLRRSRLARQLCRPVAARRNQGYRVVDSDQAIAWCDGLWLPTIYVSRGLLERLPEADLAIVLAHERAHARRYDNLSRLILDWATRLWPRRVRQLLAGDFATAAEQACDAIAAEAHGGAERVAQLIESLGSSAEGNARRRAAHWHAGVVDARLNALRRINARAQPAALAPWVALLSLWLTSSYLLTLAAHSLLEWSGH